MCSALTDKACGKRAELFRELNVSLTTLQTRVICATIDTAPKLFSSSMQAILRRISVEDDIAPLGPERLVLYTIIRSTACTDWLGRCCIGCARMVTYHTPDAARYWPLVLTRRRFTSEEVDHARRSLGSSGCSVTLVSPGSGVMGCQPLYDIAALMPHLVNVSTSMHIERHTV